LVAVVAGVGERKRGTEHGNEMYLVRGAGMAQRQDNLAEFPLGDACPRHIP